MASPTDEGAKETHGYDTRLARERAVSDRKPMVLLEHASACRRAECPGANCHKMKALLRHGAACETRATGGCGVCTRIWALLQIHALQCAKPRGACVVPRCWELRAHIGA